MKSAGPCKGCHERYPACQDYCIKFKDAKQKAEAMKQMIREKKRGDLELVKFFSDRKEERRKKYKEKLW